jgi:hypothetical protein
VTAASGGGGGSRRSRRALLQSGGVSVNVAIRAAQSVAATLKGSLGYAGPAIVNALSVPFPGFALGLVAGAPSLAPSSTSWATPGAISGVVVGGAAAITLIVLLSVFIPRMRQRHQAPVFGGGFPQQHMQQAPPQQGGGSGVQTGGMVVSF